MKKVLLVGIFLACFTLLGCATLRDNAGSTQPTNIEQNQPSTENDGSNLDPQILNKSDDSVTGVPELFQSDAPYGDFRRDSISEILKADDREVVINSGCSWCFTVKKELLNSVTQWSEQVATHLGFEMGQYLDKEIYVQTYDTVPAGSIVFPSDGAMPIYTSNASWITYLFVFCDDELIYCIQLENKDHFFAVADLCNKLHE